MEEHPTPPDSFPRPRLVVSRCLGFEPVRYNGQILRDDFVQRLVPYCEVVAVCPEVEIGLGVPRPPVRLVRARGGPVRLVQPETARDLTVTMREFAEGFLSGLGPADGFLLKSRSPSCGFRDAKVFVESEASIPADRAPGAFAAVVLERGGALACEDEGRLNDDPLRERFLTLLFGLARLRAVAASGERARLVDFHARYKYVLLAYHESGMRELGRVVASVAERPWEDTVALYRSGFARALARSARVGGHVNALQHAFGPVSEGLAPRERRFFLEQIEELRAGRLPLVSTLSLLRGWALRFENAYLEAQAYLAPYPRTLA